MICLQGESPGQHLPKTGDGFGQFRTAAAVTRSPKFLVKSLHAWQDPLRRHVASQRTDDRRSILDNTGDSFLVALPRQRRGCPPSHTESAAECMSG
jgi:hypothetical protein